MQAIVLAGGLGARLQTVLSDMPKPMAPIQGKPFLAYLLDYLQIQGVTRVVLSIHYLGEKIRAYFRSHYHGIDIQYTEESELLGTGGAVLNALSVIPEKNKPCFVLNGDTFFKLNYQAMYEYHDQHTASFSMALRVMDECSRYGKVLVDQQTIVAFHEKGECGSGLINAGVYLINPELISTFDLPRKFSIEKDFIIPYLKELRPKAYITEDYFIDIGLPQDYARAEAELVTCGVS